MVGPTQGSVTELLQAYTRGQPGALDALLPLVYEELRRRAASYLRGERHNHTLAATALVHEAYLRLVGQKADYQNRAQFFAVSATMMRRVLIDHARARAAAKRPRPKLQITLTPEIPAAAPEALDILELDRALDELASVDARQARLVELRYFGGLTSEEAARALGVSLTMAKREWNMAKAWLYRRLSRTAGPSV
jgi:RNA polymerase sigma-70 factor (ECF subfamily)